MPDEYVDSSYIVRERMHPTVQVQIAFIEKNLPLLLLQVKKVSTGPQKKADGSVAHKASKAWMQELYGEDKDAYLLLDRTLEGCGPTSKGWQDLAILLTGAVDGLDTIEESILWVKASQILFLAEGQKPGNHVSFCNKAIRAAGQTVQVRAIMAEYGCYFGKGALADATSVDFVLKLNSKDQNVGSGKQQADEAVRFVRSMFGSGHQHVYPRSLLEPGSNHSHCTASIDGLGPGGKTKPYDNAMIRRLRNGSQHTGRKV